MNVLFIDILCLISYVILAIKSRQNWTIWLAGLQLSEVLAHLPTIILTGFVAHTYEAMQGFWAVPTLFTMVVGVFFERLDSNGIHSHIAEHK